MFQLNWKDFFGLIKFNLIIKKYNNVVLKLARAFAILDVDSVKKIIIKLHNWYLNYGKKGMDIK